MSRKSITQKDVLFLSISMFVIVALWVGFNIYHAWATSTISEDLQMQIIPIEASFDTDTLNNLKTREKIEPLIELSAQVSASPAAEETTTITPTPTEEPIQTESVIIPIEEIPSQ